MPFYSPQDSSTPPFRTVRFGAFEIDAIASQLRRGGTRVKIDRRSFRILLLLIKRGGDIVFREELRQSIWPDGANADFDHNLNQVMSRLRSVLGDCADKPRYIETIQSRGYRFISTLIFVEKTASSSDENIAPEDLLVADKPMIQEAQPPAAEAMAFFGPFEFDTQSLELRKRGVLVSIHQQPAQLLLLLLRSCGHLIPREEVRQYLWPNGEGVDFERNLNHAIFKLRDALGDSAENPLFVETVPARGYRFVSPVLFQARSLASELSTDLLIGVLAEKAQESNSSDSTKAQAAQDSNILLVDEHRRAWRTRYTTVCLAALVALAAFFYVQFKPSRVAASSPRKNRRVAVAVLDFKNLSGDPHEAWLVTALSAELSTELDAGGQLLILSSKRVGEVEGKLADADYVLAGSYGSLGRSPDAQIRVDAFLRDANSGQKVAIISRTGRQSDLFSMIAGMGSELRTRMGVRGLSREETQQIAAVFPANPDALRFYAEGLRKLRGFDSVAAADYLQKSIATNANNAIAHDALAAAWTQLGYDMKARAEARKAFDLSANLSRPQKLLIEGHYQQCLKHWDRVIQIDRSLFEFFPDNAEYGFLLAEAQLNAGKQKDALITLESLKRLQPVLRGDSQLDLANGIEMNHDPVDTQIARK